MFESERRDLSYVPRWGICRVNRRQSVADHLYYTTCYALELANRIGWGTYEDRLALLTYVLRHDEREALESDIPGPIKRLCKWDGSPLNQLLEDRFGPPPKADDDMVAIRTAADVIDECMYLAGEINSGNRSVMSVFDNAKQRLHSAIIGLPSDDKQLLRSFRNDLMCAIDDEVQYVKNIAGLKGV